MRLLPRRKFVYDTARGGLIDLATQQIYATPQTGTEFEVVFSSNLDRSNLRTVEGRIFNVDDPIYIDIARNGWVDDPQGSQWDDADWVDWSIDGVQRVRDNNPPHDLMGASGSNVPNPLVLEPGSHYIGGKVGRKDGTVYNLRSTEVVITESRIPVIDIVYIEGVDRALARPLEGTVPNNARIFVIINEAVTEVNMYLDNVLESGPITGAPYDLMGTDGTGAPMPIGTANGSHTVRVEVIFNGGTFNFSRSFVSETYDPTFVPAIPVGFNVASGNSQATARWSGSINAERYRLRVDSVVIYDGPALTFSITGLTNGQTYQASISAYRVDASTGNEYASAYSSDVSFTPTEVDTSNRPRPWVRGASNNNTGPRISNFVTRPGGVFDKEGEVVEGFEFTSTVQVRANNVTFRDCVRVGGLYAIQIAQPYSGTVIEYCRFGGDKAGIQGNGSNQRDVGAHGGNITVRYSDIGLYGDACKVESYSLYEWNYVHSEKNPDIWDTHVDGMQGSGKSYTTLRYNNIDSPNGSRTNGAIFFQATIGNADQNGHRYDVFVHNNWIKGYKYGLQAENGKPDPGDWLHNFGAWDNIFIRLPEAERFDRGPVNNGAKAFLEAVPNGAVPIGWFEDDDSRTPVEFGNIYGGA